MGLTGPANLIRVQREPAPPDPLPAQETVTSDAPPAPASAEKREPVGSASPA